MARLPDSEGSIYTVSELTSQIRYLVSGRFRDVAVEGEVSNFKVYPSGHLYFTLKDDGAMIRAVFFNYRLKGPVEEIGEGDVVLCEGRVDVYEKRGEYQLVVNAMAARLDQGLLYRRFLELKEKLFREGLFDPSHKKALPFLPGRIGIITSPAGAAVRDMLRIIFQKNEHMEVLIYPVKVQGEEAPFEIVEALTHFNASREVDVIILGRGGGSLEDLAPFNDEGVARAIFASRIPVVSAVGHEVDFTIADFVADVRAPTPTAAADTVVPAGQELTDILEGLKASLRQAVRSVVERSRLSLYESAMALKERKDFFTSYRMYVDELGSNLGHAMALLLRDRRQKAEGLAQRLRDLNPETILKRGYSITTRKETGEVIRSARVVSGGEPLAIRLHEGSLDAVVTGCSDDGPPARHPINQD